jgi:putative tricarboxylic transport membrane protein
MKFNDAVTGAALFALAVFIGAYGYHLPPMPGQPYGAGAFPIVIALGLGAFSLVLAMQALRARQPDTKWIELAPWARSPSQLFNFIATLVLVGAYLFLSDAIGFIPMSIAILFILFLLQKVPVVRALVIAVGISVVIHVGFADLLRVPLPRGILTDILW